MRLFFIALFFLSNTVLAASDLTVLSLTVHSKSAQGGSDDMQIKMPFVRSGNRVVAANINDRLYMGQLGALAPKQPGKYLTAADGIVTDGISSQDFSVSRQDERVITFAFDAEGCGAYCESNRVFYSFDLASGHAITANDLFTQNGRRELSKTMSREKLTRYKTQLALLQKDMQELKKTKGAIDKESLDDLQDRIALNSDCAQRAARPQDNAALLEAFNGYAYELAKKSFNLTAGRCSNHAMHALDDVDDVTLTLSYDSLKPYLTDYGKSILLNAGNGTLGDVYGQVLRGHLGNSAIVMMLKKYDDNSIAGTYFYEKFRKPIALGGKVQGNQVDLIEEMEGSSDNPTMRLTISGSQLQGRWSGGKSFDVQLSAP